MSTGRAGPPAPAPAAPPAPARDAATVVLLRDVPGGLQTWLLTRHAGLAFAGGMSVYPGGRVDPADGEVPLARPERAAELAARFGVDVGRAHALVVAAARETFEETGVLVTVPPAPVGAGELVAERTAVEGRALAFGDLLARRGLTVDADAFRPWARWITPEAEPRRYDTAFFVAALPSGAVAADVTTESSSADWVDVRLALTDGRALMPPTRVTLADVATCGGVAAVLAAASGRDLSPVMPRLTRDGAAAVAELPDGRRVPLPAPARP